MTRTRDVQHDYREAGALHTLLNLYGFVDDGVFVTKSGDVGLVLTVDGLDDECLDPGTREQVVQQFAGALRTFDERVRVYQYVLKRRLASLPATSAASRFAAETICRRTAFLEQRGLFTIEVALVVLLESPRTPTTWRSAAACLLPTLSERRAAAFRDTELGRAIAHLRTLVEGFCLQLADTVRPRVATRVEAYALLRRLVNYDPEKADGRRPHAEGWLDYEVADSALECHREHLRLDDHFVRVLTLKEPPGQTFAVMLRGVSELPAEFIVATEWRREGTGAIRRAIQAKRRHYHNAKASLTNYLQSAPPAPEEMLIDDAAAAMVADLGACLRDLEVHGHYFGSFSLTVVLYDREADRLSRTVAACQKLFAAHDATLTEERYNRLNAWLAVVPGNAVRSLRYLYLLNTNYADLSWLFTVGRGHPHNERLNAGYLLALETAQHTPYFLNLHQDDVAHTVVLGATGSGKSFLLNGLLAHAQQYGPYTVLFDLGGSYRRLTEAIGGSYLRIGLEHRAFQINPFALAPTREHWHFLFAFVKVLLESSGQYRLTTQDDRDLYEQIENLYEVDRDQRRLLTLAHMLPRPLSRQLHKWVGSGAYADVFDHVDDTLTCARFQAFDFEGLDQYPEVLEPLLFYVLHRANAVIYDEAAASAFKLFVMDEAWRFLRNATIKGYLTEALKTWRKRNAAMILATQSPDDLDRSEVLRVVVESCATRCFLANPGLDARVYRDVFGLNETEIDRITTLMPRQEFLFKQGAVAKVLTLRVDPDALDLYTARRTASPRPLDPATVNAAV